MNTIEDLREWAGVSDDTQDAVLRKIEGGVVALLERYTNRRFISPPERATQILNGPETHSGGLSQDMPGPQQWVTLKEPPIAALTGTFTVAPGSAAVTGTGSLATTELSADPASAVIFPGLDPVLVKAITDDTTFELAEALTDGVTDATAEAPIITLETRREGATTWDSMDLTECEVEGRRIYSLKSDFKPGRRTVRAAYRRGFAEGEGPEDVSLLVLEMVKSTYQRKRRRASSVAVTGAFRLQWASFKDEAEGFMAKADLLTRPMSYGGGL